MNAGLLCGDSIIAVTQSAEKVIIFPVANLVVAHFDGLVQLVPEIALSAIVRSFDNVHFDDDLYS